MTRNSVVRFGLTSALCVGFFLGSVSAVAHATPTGEEVLKKLAENQYLPKSAGLKNITFKIDSPMLAMMGGMSIQYYWKAPDKEVCKITGLDNPMVPKDMMEKQMVSLGRLVVGQSFQEEYKDYTLKVEMDGENFKLTGTNTKEDAPASEFNLWVSAGYVPLRQTIKVANPQPMQPPTQSMTYKTAMHGDKYYVTEIDQGMGAMVMTWEEVSKILLPTSIKVPTPMGDQKMSFTEMKINGEISDEVFAKEAAEKG